MGGRKETWKIKPATWDLGYAPVLFTKSFFLKGKSDMMHIPFAHLYIPTKPF